MKIIVGLGNPGPKYAGTRHNMGFAVVDALSRKCRVKVAAPAWGALAGQGRAAGDEVFLAKPQTYMNRSGESVAAILRGTGEGPSELVVVHDDLDLPLGRIKIKGNGGDGGHNGVASVIAELGTDEFLRVRVGIGRPPDGPADAAGGAKGAKGDAVDYVLSPFDDAEQEAVAGAVERAVEALLVIVRQGPVKAMNLFNRDAG